MKTDRTYLVNKYRVEFHAPNEEFHDPLLRERISDLMEEAVENMLSALNEEFDNIGARIVGGM